MSFYDCIHKAEKGEQLDSTSVTSNVMEFQMPLGDEIKVNVRREEIRT